MSTPDLPTLLSIHTIRGSGPFAADACAVEIDGDCSHINDATTLVEFVGEGGPAKHIKFTENGGSWSVSAEHCPFDLVIEGDEGSSLEVIGRIKLKVRVNPEYRKGEELLLACFRSGQMNERQMQEHLKADPDFAVWARHRL